jgi:hypothetical protein
MEPNGSQVKQRQVSQSCLVEKTGMKVTPPAPHVFTDPVEIAKLASPTEKEFHDMWGGVKVRIQGPFATTEQMVGMMPSVTNGFGEIFVEVSATDTIVVADKIYYQKGSVDPCHMGPKLTVPYTVNKLDGISYLNFCTWGLQPNNKCTDLDPPSEDCAAGGPGGKPLMCP